MRTIPDQIRGGLMWFSILLLTVTVLFILAMSGARIDSPEEFVMALRQDQLIPLPMAFAIFLLVVTLPRLFLPKRVVLAVLISLICWLLVWEFLAHCDYTQLRMRGVDPEQALKSAKI